MDIITLGRYDCLSALIWMRFGNVLDIISQGLSVPGSWYGSVLLIRRTRGWSLFSLYFVARRLGGFPSK